MSTVDYATAMSQLDAIGRAITAIVGPHAYLMSHTVEPIAGLPGWRQATIEVRYPVDDDQSIATKESPPVTTMTTTTTPTTPPPSATLPPGFYVCNDPAHEATGYAMFRKRHATYDEAQREAERLAKANAQPFYVLRVLAKAEPGPAPKLPAPAVQVVRESETGGRWKEAKPEQYATSTLDWSSFRLNPIWSIGWPYAS